MYGWIDALRIPDTRAGGLDVEGGRLRGEIEAGIEHLRQKRAALLRAQRAPATGMSKLPSACSRMKSPSSSVARSS